jgi:hypothetical protein
MFPQKFEGIASLLVRHGISAVQKQDFVSKYLFNGFFRRFFAFGLVRFVLFQGIVFFSWGKV